MTSRVHTAVRPVRTAAVALAAAFVHAALVLTVGGPAGAVAAGAGTVQAAPAQLPAAPGAVARGLIWD
ncbi:hypothetical protein AW27_004765 [Streptomyces sp. PCS3-D2]|uniref:hypothetical protein n=1 Tax=Streptomyces sp. PCS3-D2 TaxID=1460244 RepID=UPI0004518D5F|nr:hypothetical protein [Streptomyces sp. PCS3-D2]WKV70888.1 hypothetical protein AW27_004765 [Streptomyces sp. PCS3-D2]